MASESKMKDEEDYLHRLPQIDVTGVEISPNPAVLHAELNLEVDFTLDSPVEGHWEIKYLVDSVTKRHIIHLGKTKPKEYSCGDSHFQFSVAGIDVSGVKASALTNCGLLIATFVRGKDEEVMDLNMVVQVTKQDDDSFQRRIFNPLE